MQKEQSLKLGSLSKKKKNYGESRYDFGGFKSFQGFQSLTYQGAGQEGHLNA